MFLFTGVALGVSHTAIEASGPVELVQKFLNLPSDVPLHHYRMWIQIKCFAGTTTWQDILIQTGSDKMFASIRSFFVNPREIRFILRGAKEPSPNSSPRGETGDGPTTTPIKSCPSTPSCCDLQLALSSITETTAETGVEQYIPRAVNTVEPFTRCNTSDPHLDLIPLFFPIKQNKDVRGFEVLLVDLWYLEHFFLSQLDKNRQLINSNIRVNCGDRERTFYFSANIWIGSILGQSKRLRVLFSKAGLVEAARKEQLEELKGLNLFEKVQYWISDMYEFESAVERLSCPNESDDVAPLLSPYYFSSTEARYLGNLYASLDSAFLKITTLKEVLNKLSADDTNLCNSHNLAPKLLRIFEIPKSFRNDAVFQARREEWIKSQDAIWRGHPRSRVNANIESSASPAW